jgi:hypothetical protein
MAIAFNNWNQSLWTLPVTLRDASGLSLQNVSEGEAGFHASNSGQARQLIPMEPAIAVNSGQADDQHVVSADEENKR